MTITDNFLGFLTVIFNIHLSKGKKSFNELKDERENIRLDGINTPAQIKFNSV